MEHAEERIPVFFQFFFSLENRILLRENRLRVFLSPSTGVYSLRRLMSEDFPERRCHTSVRVENYWRRTLNRKPLIFIFSYRKYIRTSFRCFKQVSSEWKIYESIFWKLFDFLIWLLWKKKNSISILSSSYAVWQNLCHKIILTMPNFIFSENKCNNENVQSISSIFITRADKMAIKNHVSIKERIIMRRKWLKKNVIFSITIKMLQEQFLTNGPSSWRILFIDLYSLAGRGKP